MIMTMGKETIGAARMSDCLIDAGGLSASLSVPGKFKKLLDGRRDVGDNGDGGAEGVGDAFVDFHAAVAAKRDRGAE